MCQEPVPAAPCNMQPECLELGIPHGQVTRHRQWRSHRYSQACTHPGVTHPGSQAAPPGRTEAAGIPISFPCSLWPQHHPQNLLLLMQTPPLPRCYQGSASLRLPDTNSPGCCGAPTQPGRDITLPEADMPGATTSGQGWLWHPWAMASPWGCNAVSCRAAPASHEPQLCS